MKVHTHIAVDICKNVSANVRDLITTQFSTMSCISLYMLTQIAFIHVVGKFKLSAIY